MLSISCLALIGFSTPEDRHTFIQSDDRGLRPVGRRDACVHSRNLLSFWTKKFIPPVSS